MTHICVGKLTIIGSDNGLAPGRRQAIIWINAGILLIGPLGTNFSEISIEILTFSFTKMRLKVSSAKWRPFCLGLNVLILKHSRYISHRSRMNKNSKLCSYHGFLGIETYTMMTSSNGYVFHVTGPLCGEFTGHQWIPLIKASDVELSLICAWIN